MDDCLLQLMARLPRIEIPIYLDVGPKLLSQSFLAEDEGLLFFLVKEGLQLSLRGHPYDLHFLLLLRNLASIQGDGIFCLLCRPSRTLVSSASVGRNSDGAAICVVYAESGQILTTSEFHQHIMLIWLHFVLDTI
ncbi:hypothetical protein Dimus_007974 [Dionaea muscipula]